MEWNVKKLTTKVCPFESDFVNPKVFSAPKYYYIPCCVDMLTVSLGLFPTIIIDSYV